MELVDIGVNLGHRSFAADREAVLSRAVTAGVRTLICTGTSVRGSEAVLALARSRPGLLYATAGVHPHDAARCDASTIDDLRALAQHPEVVAIGECGLDFNRDFSPRPVQIEWFRKQVALAKALELPLFLHEREAAAAFLEVLDAEKPIAEQVVVHCFTGDEATLREYLRRGYNIGITGWICDERRGLHLRALVKQISSARLLVETDAPFLDAAGPAAQAGRGTQRAGVPAPCAAGDRALPRGGPGGAGGPHHRERAARVLADEVAGTRRGAQPGALGTAVLSSCTIAVIAAGPGAARRRSKASWLRLRAAASRPSLAA